MPKTLIERLRDYAAGMPMTESTVALAREAATALEAAQRDAERYRWLRSDDIFVMPGQREILVHMEPLPFNEEQSRVLLLDKDLDAAIDAALLKQGQGNG